MKILLICCCHDVSKVLWIITTEVPMKVNDVLTILGRKTFVNFKMSRSGEAKHIDSDG